ncbi:MAG: hypothetical protein A2Y86_01810 [Candidatus Aminicenantes bacterium RBG_13_62_12]|nr:MAG: hypothetical protein A2Y86_01810 [Candidatus Aminicenantes bacterium RBG_13_62_12]
MLRKREALASAGLRLEILGFSIAQVYGMKLGLVAQLSIVLTATLASIGAVGAPAMGMLMLVIVLRQVRIPLEGITLIMGVERILDIFRTSMNISGDIATAAVVAHSEGERLGPKIKEGGLISP